MEPSSSPTLEPNAEKSGRRGFFLQALAYGLGAVATVVVAIPFVGFLLQGLRKKPPKWVTVGPVSKFPLDETRLVVFPNPLQQPWDGMTAKTGVYVRYEGKDEETKKDKFLVLAINCAHLGCPVSWFPQSGLFMCPCHGGVYYGNGERASGPPPRGLYRCVWEVSDGQLKVQAPHYPTLQDPLLPDDKEARREDTGPCRGVMT
jgi:Rieske Fe-S protein